AVGAAAAALTAVAVVAGGSMRQAVAPADTQLAREESGVPDEDQRQTVVCYEQADADAPTVTIEPATGGTEGGVAACELIWEARVPLAYSESGGLGASASDGEKTSAPELAVCELPDGSIAVFPDDEGSSDEGRSDDFCRELGGMVGAQ
ncbi:hypothetical protein ACFPZL_11555, partial [Leucobacter soli]